MALLPDAVDIVLFSFEFDTVYGSCLYKILLSFDSTLSCFIFLKGFLDIFF